MKTRCTTSLVDDLLSRYEQFGLVPLITGGDDEGKPDDDGNPPGDKGDTSGDKGDTKGGKSGSFKPIESQEDLDAILIKRLRRQEKNLREEITEDIKAELAADAKKQAAKDKEDYKTLYEESQAEVEKLTKKIAKMEDEVKTATIEELRNEVIDEFSLPKDLADRLRGETKEELQADAKKLAEVVGPREAPDLDLGKPPRDASKRKTKEDKDEWKSPEKWGLPV